MKIYYNYCNILSLQDSVHKNIVIKAPSKSIKNILPLIIVIVSLGEEGEGKISCRQISLDFWAHWSSLVSWNLSLTLSSFSMAFMLGALILCRMLCCSFSLCCRVFISALISSSDKASYRKVLHHF